MKVNSEVFETILSEASVDEISQKIRNFLTELKVKKRDVTRYTMTAEEVLLKHIDTALGAKIKFVTGKKFFRSYFSIEIVGQPFNAFIKGTGTSFIGRSLLSNLGLSPEYSYADGCNKYTFGINRKKINPFFALVIAIASAFIVGSLGFLLSQDVRLSVSDNFLTPVHDTFLSVLGCIAGPMIFLSVAWGIYGIGDAATLKRIGKNLLLSYIGTVYLLTVLIGVLIMPLFTFNFSVGAGEKSEFRTVLNMILNIIPTNIFSPFVEGNTLQIIFLAVVIGIAMLFLGQKTNAVALAVEQINLIVQFLIEFISRLVPYFIFLILVKMIWSGSLSIVQKVGKVFVIFIAATLLSMLVMVFYTAIRNKVNPFVIIKKGLPTFIIALATASSAAAFGSNINICENKYGIDKKITSFGIPLGMVTFKGILSISYVILAFFFAENYGIDVSPTWFFVLAFTAGILAVATPPIPGGALTAYTVLYTQLGLPKEALAITLACDTLLDFICTGGDQFIIPLILLNRSSHLGLVDKSVLRRKE